MRTRRLGLGLFIFLALAAPPRADGVSLLLVGDSITEGIMSGGSGTPFATLLAADFDVVNAGCGGATVGSWLPFAFPMPACASLPGATPNLFVARALPALPVDYAVVMLGTVDSAWLSSPALYAAQLDILVGALLDLGAGRVIAMTPPPWPGGPATAAPLLQGYREAVLALCSTRPDAICLDVHAVLAAHAEFFFSAGDPHPNALAHTAIASQIKAAVIPEPGSGLLFGFGLIGLAALARHGGIGIGKSRLGLPR